VTDHGLVLRRVQEREGKLDAGGESAKNGETLNGHLTACDNFMNLTIKEVYQTSAVSPPRGRSGRVTDHGLVLRRVQEREGKLDAGGESAPTNMKKREKMTSSSSSSTSPRNDSADSGSLQSALVRQGEAGRGRRVSSNEHCSRLCTV
jgi:U6 snRNA-associated Sm-like protein LSm4